MSLTPGAPFDWGELELAVLLLGLAVAAALGGTITTMGAPWPRPLRFGALPLVLAGLFAAAHSIQVI